MQHAIQAQFVYHALVHIIYLARLAFLIALKEWLLLIIVFVSIVALHAKLVNHQTVVHALPVILCHICIYRPV